jgi:hypothetical protein
VYNHRSLAKSTHRSGGGGVQSPLEEEFADRYNPANPLPALRWLRRVILATIAQLLIAKASSFWKVVIRLVIR